MSVTVRPSMKTRSGGELTEAKVSEPQRRSGCCGEENKPAQAGNQTPALQLAARQSSECGSDSTMLEVTGV